MVYLRGGVAFEQCSWPAPARFDMQELDRPFSMLLYLHNKTGNFRSGSIRLFWPGGQFQMAMPDSLPANVLVFSPAPLQRDASLEQLSDRNLVADILELARPCIGRLLGQMKERPLQERIHYLATSLGLNALTLHRYGAYLWSILQIPVFKSVTGKELSIFEICRLVQAQGFLGEVKNLETVCPHIIQETLFKREDIPNLFGQHLETVFSKVDGTDPPSRLFSNCYLRALVKPPLDSQPSPPPWSRIGGQRLRIRPA